MVNTRHRKKNYTCINKMQVSYIFLCKCSYIFLCKCSYIFLLGVSLFSIFMDDILFISTVKTTLFYYFNFDWYSCCWWYNTLLSVLCFGTLRFHCCLLLLCNGNKELLLRMLLLKLLLDRMVVVLMEFVLLLLLVLSETACTIIKTRNTIHKKIPVHAKRPNELGRVFVWYRSMSLYKACIFSGISISFVCTLIRNFFVEYSLAQASIIFCGIVTPK